MKLRVGLLAAAFATAMSSASIADITGLVTLAGQAPQMKDILMPQQCVGCQPLQMETVVVDKDNHLKNVVVSINDPQTIDKIAPPDAPAVINQRGCRFEPHVIGMMVGQKLATKNADQFVHNVHPLPKTNVEQSTRMPTVEAGGQTLKTPEASEIFRVKCDIHGWMVMYVAVFDHPFFAVTDDSGKFTIATAGLRDGTYNVEFWQEKYGKQAGKVTVKDGKGAVEFTVKQPEVVH